MWDVTDALLQKEKNQERLAKEVVHLIKKTTREKSDLIHLITNPKALHWTLRNLSRTCSSLINLTTQSLEEENQAVQKLKKRLKDLTKNTKLLKDQLLKSSELVAFGEVASGVIHDLRQPLGVMMGNINLLKQEKEIKIPDSSITTLQEECQHALSLLKRLEELARSKKGEAKEKVDVTSLLESALDMVKRQKSFKNIQVVLKGIKKAPLIKVKGAELEQVFIHLLMNSLEAMPQGGLLTIETQYTRYPKAPPKGRRKKWIKISFKDNGVGIAKKDLQQIFKTFFTTKKSGMGLGLSLCQRLIYSMKGKIEAKSQKGKGSELIVWLPV